MKREEFLGARPSEADDGSGERAKTETSGAVADARPLLSLLFVRDRVVQE
jgi:hypothetical protein